ncbi:MAG: excinuclease ABC subunit UvrA [Flavobacteriales bacterium]
MEKKIQINGAKEHNLKNIDVEIPHGQLTVITGVSGSGKSSLAFETLYAEGQRRFIESMSAYARQFLGKLEKPKVNFIKGLSPAIAIQQKVISHNPRSTVGTVTEIYDYLKILFAREGKTYAPGSGKEVKKDSPQDVLHQITHSLGLKRLAILAPIHEKNKYKTPSDWSKEGFSRVYLQGKIEALSTIDAFPEGERCSIVVDRIALNSEEEIPEARLIDGIQIAYEMGEGVCHLLDLDSDETHAFSSLFERDNERFIEPSIAFFSFNNPYGACQACEGFGSLLGLDPNLVFPNPNLSVIQGAIHPWKSENMKEYLDALLIQAHRFSFPVHRPYRELSEAEKAVLWKGNEYFTGLTEFFGHIESQLYKIQNRIFLSRYRGKTTCPECKGTRLRGDAHNVKIQGKSIQDLVLMPLDELNAFFKSLEGLSNQNNVYKRILPEITTRITFLQEVGLSYLTLNRSANTLSGGESQRVNLASTIGSGLVGSTYILDEPSIGLHPKDTENLIRVLHRLKDKGNTVVVVEHDEQIITKADYIVDIGPLAGRHGGRVMYQGPMAKFTKAKESTTLKYLNQAPSPVTTRHTSPKYWLSLTHATLHNLNSANITFPLNAMVMVTGVSGSGKSTLIKEVLYQSLNRYLTDPKLTVYLGATLGGDLKQIKAIELIDQNPIGRSSRSNPITYLKIFDEIRSLFADQPLAKNRNYKPGFFSFNVAGGRCESCEGEGKIYVSMQFMADVELPCEHCSGKRYKNETLEILYRDKSISDVLEMTLEEAQAFFLGAKVAHEKRIGQLFQPLLDAGLGYLQSGQASSTLSGGEAQRIKIASFLAKGKSSTPTLFFFDEPTTGLHAYDIEKLLKALHSLIAMGHSLVIIEHNLQMMSHADWIIDLGPEGGKEGGNVVFQGKPSDIVLESESHTANSLREAWFDRNSG